MSKKYFVTGIGTDVGKTIISALLVEKLGADYWKPIQAGGLDFTDTNYVESLVCNTQTIYHKEGYRLENPMSPHAAAELDNVEIDLSQIQLPKTDNTLIVEGAGGIMVPLTKQLMVLDLMMKLNLPVIVVSRNYLGSINHTLCTIELMKAKGVNIAGIIFNGISTPSTEEVITEYTGVKVLGHIPEMETLNKETIKKYSKLINID